MKAKGLEKVKHDFKEFLNRLRKEWGRYRKNRAATVGLLMVLFFIIMAVVAPILTPYQPLQIRAGESFLAPTLEHLMGTDDLGRDILSQFVYGARTSLFVGVTAALTAAIIGILIGLVAGFKGGIIDAFLMRITEIFQVIPSFLLCLVMVAIYGASLWNVILVLAVLSWPEIARLTRAECMSLRQREFVEAAKGLGASDSDQIFIEILPNAMTSAIVATSLMVANAILTEAGLAFLGLGDPSLASWGRTLQNAMQFLMWGDWWMALFPGIGIFLTVLGFNLVGDGLTDYLNPRLKEK